MTTRDDAIRAAGYALAVALSRRDALSPRAAAEAAWYPGHRLGSVEAIEAQIIRRRAAAVAAHQARQIPLAA